jgi:hypothetical protein
MPDVKRFRQHLLTGFAIASSLAFLATTFALIRSFQIEDFYNYEWRTRAKTNYDVGVSFYWGSFGFGGKKLTGSLIAFPGFSLTHAKAQPALANFKSFMWDRWHHRPYPGAWAQEASGCIPLWLPILLFAVLPIYSIRSHQLQRKRLREQNHLCVQCGYDLRATPNQCPECGTIPIKKEAISN